MTFLISTSSNVSAPSSVRYAPFVIQSGSEGIVTFVGPTSEDSPPTDLPEGPYQHNFTLSRDMMFSGLVITITPNTTFQWVAINRIIFCAAATEGLWSSPPLIYPTTLMYIKCLYLRLKESMRIHISICVYIPHSKYIATSGVLLDVAWESYAHQTSTTL